MCNENISPPCSFHSLIISNAGWQILTHQVEVVDLPPFFKPFSPSAQYLVKELHYASYLVENQCNSKYLQLSEYLFLRNSFTKRFASVTLPRMNLSLQIHTINNCMEDTAFLFCNIMVLSNISLAQEQIASWASILQTGVLVACISKTGHNSHFNVLLPVYMVALELNFCFNWRRRSMWRNYPTKKTMNSAMYVMQNRNSQSPRVSHGEYSPLFL